MDFDISSILKEWPYDPDEDIVVRIAHTDNGPKLQMRIDMGIIQMELDGHPAGSRPEGFDSWLDYFEHERDEFQKTNRGDDFFTLTSDDCKKLRREGVQYYYRYLSLMKLEDFDRVVRDTERNLRLFTFVNTYSTNEMDRWALDQYRPYVIMMHTRAKASQLLKSKPSTGIEDAIRLFDKGIHDIIEFHKEYKLDAETDNSIEMSILRALRAEFMRISPPSLEEQLEQAVKEERFEDAAQLRDKIQSKEKKKDAK